MKPLILKHLTLRLPTVVTWRRIAKPLAWWLMGLIIAALMARLIWWPLQQAVVQAQQNQLTQQTAVKQMTALSDAWRALHAQPGGQALPASRVAALLKERAEALNIDTDAWQVTQEAHGVRLRGEVGFDILLTLFADLQANHAIRVLEVQLESAGTGRVRADAVFSGMGR